MGFPKAKRLPKPAARGVLEGAQFPARVTAHEDEGRTILLIKFAPEVIERERRDT